MDIEFGSEPVQPHHIWIDDKFLKSYLFGRVFFSKDEKIDRRLFYYLIDLPDALKIFDVLVEERPAEDLICMELPCDVCGSGPYANIKFMDFRQRLGLMQKHYSYQMDESNDEGINIGIGYLCSDCIGIEKDVFQREEDSQWAIPGNNFGKISTSMYSELILSCGNPKWESRLIERLLVLDYKEFIKTPYWRVVSFFVKSKYRWMCANCRSRDRLSVHHKTYKNHGIEHKKWDTDLVCLCNSCHKKEHSI